jgi:hypothetical protein
VWGREVNGLVLTFHLAGINNQNFLMRDDQTGSHWQQISGLAVAGPLKGHALRLIASDELGLALWKAEEPDGTILKDVAKYVPQYAAKDWDIKMKKAATVLSYPEHGFVPRDLMLGVRAWGEARAWPFDRLLAEKLVKDRIGGQPVLLVVGPDGKSVRVFRNPGATDYYRTADAPGGALMMDSATGSEWNFQGCAITGPSKGTCLERIEGIADYWFDWRHYNPATTIYQGSSEKREKQPASEQ